MGQQATSLRHPFNRKLTFENVSWEKLSNVPIEQLVCAGFYYSGPGDLVRCAYCNVAIQGWADEDDPLQQHIRVSPRCEFVLKLQKNITALHADSPNM